ncbi:MAG: FtsX-like permease family protein [Campylobacterota bacterium]|nr:FtsX-like permease family protein [Campylobacterota bacterium]
MYILNRFHFLLLLLITYRKKHIAIFFISTLLIALVSSVIFLTSSIKQDIYTTLDAQADFTLQRYEAGKVLNTPQEWIDQFLEFNGVQNVEGRVYGMHFYEPNETYFMIVGVDFYDSEIIKNIKLVVENIDIDDFLKRKNMIIGSGVKAFLDEYHYFDYYIFRPPDRGKEKIYIYDRFDNSNDIVSSDVVIMDIDLARKILGVAEEDVTDIILTVPNPTERETIRTKLRVSHFNMRIIQKEDIKKHYENLYNYKGGIFLVLYIVVLSTFLLILYQRYSMIKNVDAKEVAILRLTGWRIDEIVTLKMVENFIVILSAYFIGIFLAYFFVYTFDAPVLKHIFLGYDNLINTTTFSPNISFQELIAIFFIFVIPFMITILVPVWRVSIKEPSEIIG